ncbi:hypothetical protein FOZ63_028768 [Perkinsus olseni]|uniref:Uncharacterized protein n=1 Tax=Perkinsus olseni TaxID=32597 RepID=A0A7J6R7J3_PEROL|nr:hypothetical protein FOZ63_028768 [Perkinsus olseni]KAF4716392.1 hypothetical protein FOZ62_016865 [Perkinsus olseni]
MYPSRPSSDTDGLLKSTETIRRLLEGEDQKGQLESFMARHHCSHVQQWLRALCERVNRASLLWTANGRRVGGDDVGIPAADSRAHVKWRCLLQKSSVMGDHDGVVNSPEMKSGS